MRKKTPKKSKAAIPTDKVQPSMKYAWYDDEGKLDAMLDALQQAPRPTYYVVREGGDYYTGRQGGWTQDRVKARAYKNRYVAERVQQEVGGMIIEVMP